MGTIEILRALAEEVILKSVVACVIVAVAGGVMAGGGGSIQVFLMAAVFGLVTAGFNSLNSIVDIEADRISRPERPLPSGRLGIGQALNLTIILFLSGFFLLTVFLATGKWSLSTLGLVAADFAVAIFYSVPPNLKRIGPLANAMVSAHYTILPILGEWSMFKPIAEAPFPLVAVLFFMAWGVQIIEDFEDMEGDRKVGTWTLPLSLGREMAVSILALMYSVSVLAGVLYLSNRPYWLLCLPQQILLILISLKLIKTVSIAETSRIHQVSEVLCLTTGLTLVIGYVLLS